MPSADKRANIEKKERETGSALKGLWGKGFSLDPLSEILFMTALWRVNEEGSVFRAICQWTPEHSRPIDSSFF